MWIDVPLNTATITVGTIFRLSPVWPHYLPWMSASLCAPCCAQLALAVGLRLLGQSHLATLGEPEMDEA